MSWAQFAAAAADIGKDLFLGNRQWNQTKDFTREQMAWQENMANTAYQRAAKDLEAAGLNRVLALGNSAVTPSPGSQSAPQVSNKMSTLDYMMREQEISNAKSAGNLLDAQARKTDAEADKSEVTKFFYDVIAPTLKGVSSSAKEFDAIDAVKTWLRSGYSNSKDISDQENAEIDFQKKTQAMEKLKSYNNKNGKYNSKGKSKPGKPSPLIIDFIRD